MTYTPTLSILTKEALSAPTPKPTARHDPAFRLADHLRVVEQSHGRTIVEFIGTGDFAAQWFERQRYEVAAGRDSEPLLYTPIYNEISDPSLPRSVNIYTLDPDGVVFDEITEGGEVRFLTVSSGNHTVPIKHYAVGLEYTKDLLIYNELWTLPLVERAAGAAFNALKNHVHLSPFITAAYDIANQTPASSVGATLAEKYLRTIEDAITTSMSDTTHPRRGPYAILCSSANLFTLERALMRVPQEGLAIQSSAVGRVRHLIAYDGWSGSRGKLAVSYDGVAAGKAYLINLAHREHDHQSYEKQPLQSTSGAGDLSRFILENAVLDSYFGVYCNPLASTEEITLPTS